MPNKTVNSTDNQSAENLLIANPKLRYDRISMLIVSLEAILRNNNLTELPLVINEDEDEDEDDTTYVIWYDEDGYPYDDPVTKVLLEEDALCLEVAAREFKDPERLDCDAFPFKHTPWLESIRENMLEMLERDGQRRCPFCGKIVADQQRYCSQECRERDNPPTPQQVAEVANKRIDELIDRIARNDDDLRRSLLEKYTISI